MNHTLGLDLGSNSLGWAIINDISGDIVDKGVLVFPEGVDLDAGSSVETPAAVRRAARMGRRMKFRRKLRKWHLLKLLIEHKMCPLAIQELDAWRKCGTYPLGNRQFIDWLKSTDTSNPYCDRNAAASGRVEPFTLGRALYHICQRRGFKSSRKDEAALVDAETGEIGKPDKATGAVKSSIADLSAQIAAAGCKTLGQYFFQRLESEKDQLAKSRIRCRYTGRIEHYLTEFNVIMDTQEISPNDKFRADLHNAIFSQRPLRSQKHLVGKCPLEPRQPRAQIGHPAFEEFRMLSFINNLSFEDYDGNRVPLTADDRALVASAFMRKSPTFKFDAIIKLFKKDPRFKNDGFSFHYYRPDDPMSACATRCRIKDAFGEIPYDEQMVFDAIMFFDDNDKLIAWFKRHYPSLSDKSAAMLASIHPREGNANYSLKAINRILPFLRMGYELSQARFYAKLPDIISDFATDREKILRELEGLLSDHRKAMADYSELEPKLRKDTPKPQGLYDLYREYLLNHYGIIEDQWRKLYLRGDEEYQPETCYYPHGKNGECVKLEHPRLPPVRLGMIRNPLVQRSMTTLRRLVNYLAEHGKLDTSDTIRIELARSVNDFATRRGWQLYQAKRAKLRAEAAEEIVKHGKAATPDAIERYVLWKEQEGHCLYTGKTIDIVDLLSGNAFDIEHTIPRSLSGDDSMANKTICDAIYNRQVKCGRVPRECPDFDRIEVQLRPWKQKLEKLEKEYRNLTKSARAKTDSAAKSSAREKAVACRFERDYWRDKLRRFEIDRKKLESGDNELSGFKKRQLVDTGIMSSHAVSLLKCLYPRTYAVNGAATAFARKAWGIQADETKDRSEHTHHAKDAMVIAALTPKRFTAICTALKDDGTQCRRECDVCPPPFPDFPDFAGRVRTACGEILVKHILRQTTLRQSSKRNALAHSHHAGGDQSAPLVKAVLSKGDTVRGQLHKDTFYGCISNPISGKQEKVVRKSLIGPIKDAEKILDKIVDPAIRTIVENCITTLKKENISAIEPGMIKMPSGVPVNKVRIFTPNATNANILRDHVMPSDKDYKNHYYVTSGEGSNFRLALFADGKVKADNSLVWAQNHKSPDYEPYDRMPDFVGYIMPGSMALTYREGHPEEIQTLSQKELANRLYKVVKFSSSGQMTFRRHTEARASVVLAKDLKDAGKHAAGESKISIEHPHELLLMSAGIYCKQMLFEGIHFKMMLDGSIRFLAK